MGFLPQWARFETRAAQAAKVILSGLKMPGAITHAPYRQLSKESYERNITIYSCVNEIATAASSVPWVLMKRGKGAAGGGKFAQRMMTEATARKSYLYRGARQAAVRKSLQTTAIENHPLLTLLEKPNPDQAQADYIVQKVSYFLLAGNSYEEFVGPETGPNKGKPMEIWNLRPDRVKVVPNTSENRRAMPALASQVDPTVMVLAYRYESDTNTLDYAPSTVIHKKFFHPTDDFYGLSPLQVAMRSYMTDNLSADWNFALLQNEARPSGALVAPNAINDDSYERIKMEIRESYGGPMNAGMPMFLEGGLKWTPLGLSPLEMDWLASREWNRVEMCAIYHVPPELVGDASHKTYNSFPEARRAFWMEAVLPILDSMRDSYNQRLVPIYGDSLFLDYDRDQIDALVEEQKLLWDRLKTADHLSINEKRDAAGMESYDGDPEVDPVQDVPVGLLPKESIRVTDPNVPENLAGDGTVDVQPAPDQPKAQRLTRDQAQARKRLKAAIAAHYRDEGAALAKHVKQELNKL